MVPNYLAWHPLQHLHNHELCIHRYHQSCRQDLDLSWSYIQLLPSNFQHKEMIRDRLQHELRSLALQLMPSDMDGIARNMDQGPWIDMTFRVQHMVNRCEQLQKHQVPHHQCSNQLRLDDLKLHRLPATQKYLAKF